MSDPATLARGGGRQPRRRGSAVGRAGPAAHRLRLAARRRGRGLGVRLQQRRLPRRRRPVDDWAHGRIDTPRVRRWLSGRRGRGVRRRPPQTGRQRGRDRAPRDTDRRDPHRDVLRRRRPADQPRCRLDLLGDDGRNLGARPTQRRVPVADLPGDLIERRRRPA